jgi:hypothetical protein
MPEETVSAASPPPYRRLRTYAYDPSLTQLATAKINLTTVKVRWERTGVLQRGPVGEYVEVVDYDPPSGCFYAPIDLDDNYVLAQDGLEPSEGNPQFHQQMVYAVVMKTIENFEHALGRVVLWSARKVGEKKREYVQRLRVYPHALREANAYYSPEKKALLFGYFPASLTDPGNNLPGGMVFTCLSHDIIAHETTHALLDGIHPRFIEPTNADTLAFHEAFADIVALLQHFTYPEALRQQIAKTRGELGRQNLLGQLAQQFGQAIGNYGALRDAIGQVDPQTHEWQPHAPDPAEYATTTEPHARGSLLVAALFDAFLSIYRSRVGDLLRIATAGTGVLPEGEIHPDLVNRLAEEASKSAQHLLTMCIRALDYCPPVDLSFGDYLRALITADSDLVPDDDRGYRLAVTEAFRRRGIFPRDVRTLAVDSLRWEAPELGELPGFARLLKKIELNWDQRTDREVIYETMRANCVELHNWLQSDAIRKPQKGALSFASQIGLSLDPATAPKNVSRNDRGEPLAEVHSVRPVRRVGPDGQLLVDLVVEITQRRFEPIDPKDELKIDPQNPGKLDLDRTLVYRGGCTMIIDLETRKPRYLVVKNITSENRLRRQREFIGEPAEQSLYATYFGGPGSQQRVNFAVLHRAL